MTVDVVGQRPWLQHYPAEVRWDAPIDTKPVHERIEAACSRYPDSVAIDFLGKRTTYADLGRMITAFAGALQQKFGVTKGTRVALMLPNTHFYVVAYYAVLRAGGTVVNCNPLYSLPELTHILDNAEAELLITLDLKQLFEKAEALVQAGQAKRVIACHFPDALPLLKKLLYKLAKSSDLSRTSASPIADRVTHFGRLMGLGLKPKAVSIDPHVDCAVQQYTGGTTGIPKGAMLTHANISANAEQSRIWFERVFRPGNRGIAVLPFFHIFAMTTCLNVPLASGMTMFLLPRFELKGFLDLLMRSRATLLPAVPTLISALARNKTVTREHLASLEVVVSGGASLANELRSEFATKSEARLIEGYGLSEASPVVCCGPLDGVNKPQSIGQPFPATDIRFFDIETNEVAGLNAKGELQLKGPQVMTGYYNDPEASEGAFMDGWLRTGDVGYMDEEGYVFLVDRIKDLIICSGFNVYPRNIEAALMQHPAVEETSVIGVPDRHRGEAPVAFVKLKEGQSVTDVELKSFVAQTLSKIEMPREIIFKSELPKTLIGKLSKKELREEYKAQRTSDERA